MLDFSSRKRFLLVSIRIGYADRVKWVAPSEKDNDTNTLEKRLWEAADQLRANSGLNPQQYSGPVLGLIFLRLAEVRFAKQRAELQKQASGGRRRSRLDDPAAYHADGILFLAPNARCDFLLSLPEGANIGSKVNDAMRAIERDNPQLAGVLPKTFELFSSTLLKQLLKRVSEVPATLGYDAFGRRCSRPSSRTQPCWSLSRASPVWP